MYFTPKGQNNRVRCGAEATCWLIEETGKRTPGGYMCGEHGREIVDEYREVLGWEWSLQAIDEHGDPVEIVRS
jgi:hypothetical protein